MRSAPRSGSSRSRSSRSTTGIARGHRRPGTVPARVRRRHRPDGFRQVDHAGVHGRRRQHGTPRPHHDGRGPDRVPAQAQELHREPARGRGRHARVRPARSSTCCARTPTSSWSVRCVTSRRSRPRSPRPRPATSSSRPCTRRTRRRRSTASSTCSRRTSSSRCACSSPTTLQGVVTQQLIPTADGQGRAVACEVLVTTPAIRNLIREGKVHQIYSSMQAGGRYGMQTMDMSLAQHVEGGPDHPAARVRALPRCRGAPAPHRRGGSHRCAARWPGQPRDRLRRRRRHGMGGGGGMVMGGM